MFGQLDVEIRDTVFDPDTSDKQVHVRQAKGGKPHYKVWLYIDGEDLPYVKKMTYILHPTFLDRERKVKRSMTNPNCQLVIWTWGIFAVRALLEDKRGEIYELDHMLEYDKQLEEEGVSYARSESTRSRSSVRPKKR